jgi:hypothetical protein
MNDNTDTVKKNWKQKLFNEFSEYFINVAYLALFISAVVFYRRQVLAFHGIILDDYFFGLIKALVIGKVIMVGAFLRISRKYEHKPLIIPTIYKSIIFTLWVMVFDIIEVYIKSFIHTSNFSGAFSELMSHINQVWLAGAILIFIAFLPFFALKEIARSMGRGKLGELFLKKQE